MRLICRYMDFLETAAAQIAELQELPAENALVINLGPTWLRSEAYSLFNNNVIENQFKEWESPPGLGICPLDVIFAVCSNLSSWLALSEKNHVVGSHSRPAVLHHSDGLAQSAAMACDM